MLLRLPHSTHEACYFREHADRKAFHFIFRTRGFTEYFFYSDAVVISLCFIKIEKLIWKFFSPKSSHVFWGKHFEIPSFRRVFGKWFLKLCISHRKLENCHQTVKNNENRHLVSYHPKPPGKYIELKLCLCYAKMKCTQSESDVCLATEFGCLQSLENFVERFTISLYRNKKKCCTIDLPSAHTHIKYERTKTTQFTHVMFPWGPEIKARKIRKKNHFDIKSKVHIKMTSTTENAIKWMTEQIFLSTT